MAKMNMFANVLPDWRRAGPKSSKQYDAAADCPIFVMAIISMATAQQKCRVTFWIFLLCVHIVSASYIYNLLPPPLTNLIRMIKVHIIFRHFERMAERSPSQMFSLQ